MQGRLGTETSTWGRRGKGRASFVTAQWKLEPWAASPQSLPVSGKEATGRREGAGKKALISLSSCSLISFPMSQPPGGRTQTEASQEGSLGKAVIRNQIPGTDWGKRGECIVGGEEAKQKKIHHSLFLLRLKLEVHTGFQLSPKTLFILTSYLIIYHIQLILVVFLIQSYYFSLAPSLTFILFSYISNNPEFNCFPYIIYVFYQALPEQANPILVD